VLVIAVVQREIKSGIQEENKGNAHRLMLACLETQLVEEGPCWSGYARGQARQFEEIAVVEGTGSAAVHLD
jgi:hypothetical protein